MFVVKTYDVSAMSDATLAAGTMINGGNYPNWSASHTFTPAEGYLVSTFHCRLIAKCDTEWGLFGDCPAKGIPETNVDIALLKCEDRPANSPSLPVVASDPETGPVEMNWFHEVYRIATQPDEAQIPPGAFAHYTALDTDHPEENFHYLGASVGAGEKNQLLPLRALPWPNNTPRTRNGAFSATVVSTDLYGCHGTSGSGILELNGTGGHSLLGPVSKAGSKGFVGRLCEHGPDTSPGAPLMGYTRAKFTRALADWAILHP
jgi:hypothetical protein